MKPARWKTENRGKLNREGGFRISHGIIGTHRGAVTIVLFVCLTVMLGLSADLITPPSSGPSTMAIVVGIGILLVISLASLVSLKAEDAE